MWKNNDTFFRAGAGVVVLDAANNILMFERSDIPGSFQFSQGGLDPAENPRVGAFRELLEETGISIDSVDILGELPFWVSYMSPTIHKGNDRYHGQTQRWFYARLHDDYHIDLSKAQDNEFVSYKWVSIHQVVNEIIDFKKGMYTQIIEYLEKHIL